MAHAYGCVLYMVCIKVAWNFRTLLGLNFSTSTIILCPGFDYENTVTTITFGPGVSALTVNVPILDDDIAENIEMFSANLRLPAGSTDIVFLDPDRANATILDNDGKWGKKQYFNVTFISGCTHFSLF